MGVNFSNFEDISSNIYLNNFCQLEKISESDPFWNQFVSFPIVPNYTKNEDIILKKNLTQSFNNLVKNYFQTRNIISFVNVFLIRIEELKRDVQCNYMSKESIFIKQLYNSMFIIRNMVRCFTEEGKLSYMFLAKDLNKDESHLIMKKLISTLICLSIEIPIKDITFSIHLEAILSLTFIMNNDIYCSKKKEIERIIFEDEFKIHSRAFLKSLLRNITGTYPVPDFGIISNKEHIHETDKDVSSLSSTFWGYVSLGYYPFTNRNVKLAINSLSSHSVFLVLKLCIGSHINDIYSKSLFSMHDSFSSTTDLQKYDDVRVINDTTLEISFSDILNVLISNFDEEHFVLLFYLFLYRNSNFRNYILSKESFKEIIIPLTKLIYDYSTNNSNGVYMALIILLILTENNYFNSTIQRENIAYLGWIKEKTITNMSLGSLIVWILCRSIQFNLGHIGDRYIHTNCLAALANMSSKIINLHPQASEQIMVLLNILIKRKTVISNSLKSKKDDQDTNEEINNLNSNLSIVDDVLQMLVEIINTALIFSLNNNSHMIHTFLYHRKQFILLKQFQNIQSHACNIEAILTYFSTKIEKELGKSVSSQTDVLKIINDYSPTINKLNNFKRFPELRFKYIEEESAEDFFVPYIWNILCKMSFIFMKQCLQTSDCKC